MKTENQLTRLYSEEKLMVRGCSGTEIIAQHHWGVFLQGIGSRKDRTEPDDFRNPVFTSPGTDKEGGPVEVYRTAGGTFSEMFALFDRPLENLAFNQGQIGSFCYHHPDKVGGALFLFEAGGKIFVASVFSYKGFGLKICATPFELDRAWSSREVTLVVPEAKK